ncbi:uncharacterized protein LOC106179052 [Lingula anatina]|uniref:Uncharacterized protein LOC106179052 n=1 Tax=Lingula anatina TaxID=7574 RepID=A0A1S3K675_LINAN|nr:uncharacterized protein LOC106179052 [Lingula anatina]|eukprot:XP_013418012.1 uncharacterized protein LOC106179052 [Lingula anatina]
MQHLVPFFVLGLAACALIVSGATVKSGWYELKDAQPIQHMKKKDDQQITQNAHSDNNADHNADISSDSKADISSDSKADISSDSKADISSDSKADISSDSKADISSDSKADISSDSKADISSDSKADISSDSKADISSDISSDSKADISSDQIDHNQSSKDMHHDIDQEDEKAESIIDIRNSQQIDEPEELAAEGPLLKAGVRFVTSTVKTNGPKELKVYSASTCSAMRGKDVSVSVLLMNNQNWNPDNGVVYFYVTNKMRPHERVTGPKVLCSNTRPGKPPKYKCKIRGWDSKRDLYVFTTTGDVMAVSYSIIVEFKERKKHYEKHEDERGLVGDEFRPFTMPSAAPYRLVQTVFIKQTVKMPYQTNVLIKMWWCPGEHMKKYKIQSTVLGVGLQSSFNQYVCHRRPCTIDGRNVIASNPNQLPMNMLTVNAGGKHEELDNMYVLIRCWGGDYDPKAKDYTGKFQYGALLRRD